MLQRRLEVVRCERRLNVKWQTLDWGSDVAKKTLFHPAYAPANYIANQASRI
jgi:hypothetical protein